MIYIFFCVWVQVKDIRAKILFILKKSAVVIVNKSLYLQMHNFSVIGYV